ncbi:polysaccharide biosynthesis/export family protein [Marinibaculum pumilum]|uniref:Polysaccharide biosynthesis/export family protein n=1 Tax=Marinibaculum pumilum TaxID=1766165 RepID=A0ABV7L8P2_9PROT
MPVLTLLLALLGAVVLSACQSREIPPPPVSKAGQGEQVYRYRLGAGDKLAVKVFGQDDLSGEFEISGDGQLAMPLIGQVDAAGLTLAELRQELVDLLNKNYLVDPQVTVEVANYRPFFILGQVRNPGSFPYQSGLNMRQAVALAGGYTNRALQEPMIVIRQNEENVPTRYSVTQDYPVLPGDTIEVQRRLF